VSGDIQARDIHGSDVIVTGANIGEIVERASTMLPDTSKAMLRWIKPIRNLHRREETSAGDQLNLVFSGFATIEAYEARRASWDPEDTFSDLQSAEEAARRWIAERGEEAQVEVIRIDGTGGTVIEVITRDGTESVTA
jgi:hypothetical protein